MVDLKRLLPKKGDEDEFFWSLLIEPGWVQAGIWKIEEKKAKVVITSPTTPWNLDEDIVASSDSALSAAIQGFPEDFSEPVKTVFGVSSSWVKKGQISEEYLEKIKKVCAELSLTPIGFVVLPEALAHYKKLTEGAPLSAVTLGVYKENLEISIFSKGNLSGTSQVARSVSLEDDVSEGLARFAGEESIPSRFLLYNGKEGELEEARQSLLKVNWEDFSELKILHTPKIETVDVKTKVHAVCLAGASEIAEITALEVLDDFIEDKKSVSKGEQIKEMDLDPVSLQKEPVPSEKFVSEGYEAEKKEVFEDEIQDEKTAEDLGFAINKDITPDISFQNTEEQKAQEIESYHENVEPVKENIAERKDKISIFRKIKNSLSKMKTKFTALASFVKIPKGISLSSGKKIFILGPSFLLLFFSSGFAAWWFLPKATVTIYLSPQKLGETTSVYIDTNADASDFEKGVLTGEKVEVSVSGEKTKDTSGSKTVGEKAEGEVTLYRVGPEIDLDADTVLNGPENLKFELDSDVTIASGSASSPGTTKVGVTAQDIGAEYNLAGGTSFSVSNYSQSDIEAKNENSFSGGSSREINAVSAEDIEVLEEDLLEELSDDAKNELGEKIEAGKYFVEESVDFKVSEKSFSADEGDEASSLKLSMDVTAEALFIEKSVLNQYAQIYLSEKVPQRYVLREEQITYEFDYKEVDDGIYEFELRISANLLPEINKDEIAQRLKGKHTDLAEEYLNKEVAGFVRAEVKIKPNLPEKLKTLPHVVKNIEVEFAAEKQ